MKFAILLTLIFSFSAVAKVNFELLTDSSTVKQGEMASGKLILKESSGQTSFSGLKGKAFGKTLYLHSLSPFMGKQGELQSDVKAIFIAVPQSNSVSEMINGEEIVITWSNIQVEPIEESQNFLYGDFEIPERLELFPWILTIAALVLLIIVGRMGYNKYARKQAAQIHSRRLKDELLNCKNYEDIVLMWRQKRVYLDQFPQLDTTFKHFEETLFKYQFKPQRTEKEIEEVQKAYAKFKDEVAGGLSGI